MILQSLVRYFGQLKEEHPEEVCGLGWEVKKVSGILDLGEDGNVVSWTPTTKAQIQAPAYKTGRRGNRIDGIAYCDTPAYVLGVSAKDPERALSCFDVSSEFHLGLLKGLRSPQAQAVRAFFSTWSPEFAETDPVVGPNIEGIRKATGSIMLAFGGRPVVEYADMKQAWEDLYDAFVTEDAGEPDAASLGEGIDLVTGQHGQIARVHPIIKGFGQSSGMALVSFNKRAFEKWGNVDAQGANAGTSIRSAHAYTTALQYLFRNPLHNVRVGDDLIYVFWGERDDERTSAVVRKALGGRTPDGEDPAKAKLLLAEALDRARQGASSENVDLDAEVCVLGLKANAGRLAPVCFERTPLRLLLARMDGHYGRLVPDGDGGFASPWRLVQAVRSPYSKKWSSSDTRLYAQLVNAILTGGKYPASLHKSALAMVLAAGKDKDGKTPRVSKDRASIARMVLVRNYGMKTEDLDMDDVEACREPAWAFGRYLAVLESMQYAAHGKRVSANITDRYFSAAMRTPRRAYAATERYVQIWGRKIEVRRAPSIAVAYRKKLEGLRESFGLLPIQFDMRERSLFALGYYAERKKTFEEIAEAKAAQAEAEGSQGKADERAN